MAMTATASRAGRREWIGLAVIALPCLVYAMDLTVLNLALPAISRDLRPSGAEQLWIVDIYGFMVAGALTTMGALGDRIGARRLLVLGAAAFAGASALAAFAPTAPLLIAARALLGLAGATLAPSTLSLIRIMFEDERQRTVAIGVWVTSYSLGAAVGPLAGGALLQVAWWGSVFLLALPVMALVLLAAPRFLPEHRAGAQGGLDLWSAGLSLAAVLASIYGLKQMATLGLSFEAGAAMALAAVLAGAFVLRQRALADPLIDLGLFRAPAFSAAVSMNIAAFFVIFGMSLFLAQYLQSVLGLSPFQAGLWSVPEALAFIVGSMLTPSLESRLGSRPLISIGLAVGALGYLIVATTRTGPLPLVAGATIAAIGLAAVVTLVTDTAVGAAPASQAGAASAVSETSSELGGALGIAILGSIGAAVFRAGLDPATAGNVPAPARETLGAALAAGQQLPGSAGADLIETARAALTSTLAVTASVGAATLLAAAVAGWALLRRERRSAISRAHRDPCVPAGAEA
jgi:MFS transporter, DHA2 family, multidrug resistance protein